MALKLNDRVKETSTTTGTGTLNLGGAVSGFETFVAGIGDGNTTYYSIAHRSEDEWETGLGTITDASTDTLARTTVISSSNSDSAVDFSAGTKDVFCTLPASKVSFLDASNDLILGAGAAGVDYSLKFDGETSDGVITWMEDEDSFKVEDDLVMDSSKRLYLYDEGGEHISGDGTDLTIASGGDATIDAGDDIVLDADGANVTIKDGGTTTLDIVSNGTTDVTLDAPGDIKLDADGGDIFFVDGGTTFGSATNTSGNLIIKSGTTTALTFSGANATLAGDLTISGDDLTMGTNTSGAVLVADGTNFNPVVISGDVSIGTTGTAAIGSGVIVNADVNASAAIADSKLATISTADKVSGAAIQIDGATDGTSITVADADKILIDDAGTTKYITASHTSGSVAADDISTGDGAVTLATSSGNITIDAAANNTDIIFKGTDATSDITMLTLDGSEAGAATFNNKVVATELDISGNMDIDGTSNLDIVDIDGAVQIDGTVTVGVDDTGLDVKFFGATAGSYLLWDESADSLLLTDSTPLKIGDSQDLTLYHDGTNSYITNSQGALKVATETSGIAVTIGHTTSETTIADNATVTGNLSVGGDFDVTGSFDMSDADITNIGSIALDTITNDGTDITLDSSGDIKLDAGGADINLFDDGTQFGSLQQSGGELLIRSGSTPTTAVTFSGANTTLAGTLGVGAITGTSTIQGTTITATTAFVPDASDGAALGTTALEFSDLFLADGAVINLGDDQDITLTHVADTGLTMGGSNANGTNLQITNSATDGDAVVQFALGGTVQYAMGVEDGDSDKFVINYGTGALGAQPALEISSAGAVTVPGDLTVSGTLTGAASAGFALAMAVAL
jgi:hypothetical protein